MELSTAIRLGAMLKPQARGAYQRQGGSCAYGAAMDAIGISCEEQEIIDDRKLIPLFPICDLVVVCPCPMCYVGGGKVVRRMISIIPDLNDQYQWTREKIADWVETIEQIEAAKSEPIPEPALVAAQ